MIELVVLIKDTAEVTIIGSQMGNLFTVFRKHGHPFFKQPLVAL